MCVCVSVGVVEADHSRAPRLLPAAGVHPAVQVLHDPVPPPAAAQPGAAAAAQPQGGQEVRIAARQNTQHYTHASEVKHSLFLLLAPYKYGVLCCRSTMKHLLKTVESGIQANNIGSPYPCNSAML